jgi:hypothetical protein
MVSNERCSLEEREREQVKGEKGIKNTGRDLVADGLCIDGREEKGGRERGTGRSSKTPASAKEAPCLRVVLTMGRPSDLGTFFSLQAQAPLAFLSGRGGVYCTVWWWMWAFLCPLEAVRCCLPIHFRGVTDTLRGRASQGYGLGEGGGPRRPSADRAGSRTVAQSRPVFPLAPLWS